MFEVLSKMETHLKRRKKSYLTFIGLVFACCSIALWIDYQVSVQTRDKIFHNIEDLPNKKAALVLVTS